MADVNPGEIVRVSTRFKTAQAGDVVNVYRWRNDGAAAVSDTDFIAACKAKLSTAWALIATDIHDSLDPYDIRFDVVEYIAGKEVVTKALGTDSWVLSTPPSGAGDMMPPMDAAVVNFRSNQPGSFGRKYIGPYYEGSHANGSLMSAGLTRLGQWATEILTAIAAGGQNFGVGAISEKVGYAGNWIGFTAAIVNSILGTQRRRRKNVGS